MRRSAGNDEIGFTVEADPLDGRLIGRQDPPTRLRIVDPVEPDILAGRGVFVGDARLDRAGAVGCQVQDGFRDQLLVFVTQKQDILVLPPVRVQQRDDQLPVAVVYPRALSQIVAGGIGGDGRPFVDQIGRASCRERV